MAVLEEDDTFPLSTGGEYYRCRGFRIEIEKAEISVRDRYIEACTFTVKSMQCGKKKGPG
jgi:hypothetical protein